MCGINGILSGDFRSKQKITRLNRMLKHRGPDDEGFVLINTAANSSEVFSGDDSIPYIKQKYKNIKESDLSSGDLVFGHRRLSIIDLSEGGHGPMCDSSGKIWITYNGEIYNYIELREQLVSRGYKFRTSSDTEVIINSYIEWGEECLNLFNGMWAFALWDGNKKKLFLARDRFGVKPLYYISVPGLFAFSSEIKPLALLLGSAEIDEMKIPFFILYGNRLNTNDTYFKNILSIQPAHYLTLTDGKTKYKQYYDIENKGQLNKNEDELCSMLDSLLLDSVKLRFRSDVPVGTCLSGGFDSTGIVSFSTEIKKRGIDTFSAVWSDKASDESRYIDIVNERFGCAPNKIEPKAEDFEKIFTDLNYSQEIPSEGPGIYPQWHVMSKANGVVKVLLDGQGGDEVFGGYFPPDAYLRSILKDRNMKGLLRDYKMFTQYLNKNGIHSFSNWLFPKFYGNVVRKFSKQKYGILNREIYDNLKKNNVYFDSEPPKKFDNYLNNLSYHFITSLTIPTLLHYEDRSSMAFSIESRVPFLDYRVVEFGLNLKPEHLMNKGVRRYLYRKALEKRLPKEVSERKDKLGYPTPFASWTKNSLKNYITDTLLNSSANINKYLDSSQLNEMLRAHFSGEKDFSWNIWRFLSLEKIINIYKGLGRY